MDKQHSLFIFSGHVIPADHLLTVALDKGPSGKDLDFTYQSRDSEKLVGAAVMQITEFLP